MLLVRDVLSHVLLVEHGHRLLTLQYHVRDLIAVRIDGAPLRERILHLLIDILFCRSYDKGWLDAGDCGATMCRNRWFEGLERPLRLDIVQVGLFFILCMQAAFLTRRYLFLHSTYLIEHWCYVFNLSDSFLLR